MYKKKLLLILVLTITFLSFNLDVKAATEGYCLYNSEVNNTSFMIKQNTKGDITYYYAEGKPEKDTSEKWKKDSDNKYKYQIKDDVSTPLEKCPTYMQYNYITGITFYNTTNGSPSPNSYINITAYKATINKPVSNKDNSENSNSDTTTIIGEKVEMDTCEEVLGEDLVALLQDLVNIVKIAIPIILIVLGTLDFGKAILSSDENEMKKAQGTFIKRLIIAVAIFLIPSLLGVILDIANNIWGNIDTTLCGIEF